MWVFPRDTDPEYKDIDAAHYACRAQDRIQKEILIPLGKARGSAKRCKSVPPKPALSNDKKKVYAKIFDKTIGCYSPGRNCDLPFLKIRENQYQAYLEIATLWVKACGPLLPNEIVVNFNNEVDSEVVECEWQRLVRHMKSKGSLKNCLANCDVSKNIRAIQMDLCALMGALLLELNDEPWKGKGITCSHNLMLCKIESGNLQSEIKFIFVLSQFHSFGILTLQIQTRGTQANPTILYHKNQKSITNKPYNPPEPRKQKSNGSSSLPSRTTDSLPHQP